MPDRDTLHELYVVEKKSLADIGRVYGVHRQQARRWLLRAGIETRDISTATKLAWKGQSEAQRAAVVKNAAVARTFITAESHAKQAAAMAGRTPPNKGKPWTPEERAKHMATRATDRYRENLSASLRGEKNVNWKGGVTPESAKQLQGWKWRKRRREVYERDNWTCQDCGCKCLNTSDSRKHPKRKIQAHHIVSRRDGGSDDLSNLITLCMSCHHRRERAASKE